jgi:hypothetical protein
MLVKSRKLYGVKVWGMNEACKQTDTVLGIFSKRKLDESKYTANGAVELETGRDSSRGNTMAVTV